MAESQVVRAGWPALPITDWQPTRDTVQLWTQIVGKTRLALAPPLNHWWGIPLYVNGRGLTTSLMPYRGIGVEVSFDFVAHALDIQLTTGAHRRMTLAPRSVADFYREYRAQLAALGIDVHIVPWPVEISEVVPFDQDRVHTAYDAQAMHAFWTSLVSANRVFDRFRAEFRGKASPVHFFWGGFDLAVTRFSGRPAPRHPGGVPNCPDRVMWEAYSDEVSSAGYWPGGADEGVFYSYAYPEPAGYRDQPAGPGAYFDAELGEYVLPYAAVRAAPDPDAMLLDFLRHTYRAAATTGDWPQGRKEAE
ncbi:DUF5996 family protein [Asanoa sp. NPDC049573]|uniref:DUF5996 family protein n=1 Tax=Asanoa sp. NPDC049573 TaxID=3155396 RepID=UPI003427779F